MPDVPVDYDMVAAQAIRMLDNGVQVVAGQRDEGFYVNLGVFDLLSVPPVDFNTPDSTAGLNVHSIAIELPIAALTSNRRRPQSPTDANAVIGVWSTASRQTFTRASGRRRRAPRQLGAGVAPGATARQRGRHSDGLEGQVQFLPPTRDAAALPFVVDPEVPKLLLALFGVKSPAAQRPGHDFPEGHPRTDIAGFPNGRRVGDDVTDIALRAMAGATPLTPQFNTGINAQLSDGVSGNDVPYLSAFPYLASPQSGNP